jgi:hypothetical protein
VYLQGLVVVHGKEFEETLKPQASGIRSVTQARLSYRIASAPLCCVSFNVSNACLYFVLLVSEAVQSSVAPLIELSETCLRLL